MPFAWIESDTIRDIAPGDPAVLYHPDVAAHYDTPVPEEAQRGWRLVDGVWTAPPPPPPPEPVPEVPPPPPVYRPLTKLEFATLLAEAGGMTMGGVRAAAADPGLADLWFVVDLAQSVERDSPYTQAGLDQMVALNHLTATGRQAVLDGWPTV